MGRALRLATLGVPVGGGGVPWTPADVSTLALWAKADAGVYTDAAKTTAATNGQLVYTWVDQKGGADLVQATEGNRPTYTAAGINGLPSLTFNAAHWLTSTFDHVSGYTAVYVVYTTNGALNKYLCGDTAIVDNYLYVLATEAVRMGTNATIQTDAGDFPLSTNVCLYAVFNGASSSLEINGTVEASGNVNTLSLDDLCVGTSGGGGNPCWIGQVGEVLYFTGVLDDVNKAALKAYITARWGVSFT